MRGDKKYNLRFSPKILQNGSQTNKNLKIIQNWTSPTISFSSSGCLKQLLKNYKHNKLVHKTPNKQTQQNNTQKSTHVSCASFKRNWKLCIIIVQSLLDWFEQTEEGRFLFENKLQIKEILWIFLCADIRSEFPFWIKIYWHKFCKFSSKKPEIWCILNFVVEFLRKTCAFRFGFEKRVCWVCLFRFFLFTSSVLFFKYCVIYSQNLEDFGKYVSRLWRFLNCNVC